jgi:hypothetical protein
VECGTGWAVDLEAGKWIGISALALVGFLIFGMVEMVKRLKGKTGLLAIGFRERRC